MTQQPASDRASNSAPDWYRSGLHFGCTACGDCCSGAPGYVWISAQDQRAMAQRLALSADAFAATYLRLIGDRLSLIERPNGDCVFLGADRRCEIHDVKPRQCVTYPFWPRLVATAQAWQRETECCPGITQGRAFTRGEIDALTDLNTPRAVLEAIMRGDDS